MPLTINVGLSRKASENFQSTGTSINITAELDQSLLARPDQLQQEIDRLYGLCGAPHNPYYAEGRVMRSGHSRRHESGGARAALLSIITALLGTGGVCRSACSEVVLCAVPVAC